MKRVISLALLSAFIFAGCGQSGTPVSDNAASQSTSSSKEVYIMASKIESNEQAAATSKISARASKILVDVGSKVKQGDPLIVLDTKDTEAQVKQKEAALSTSKANLNNTLAGSRPEQVLQAQAALDSAKEGYDNTKSNYDRTQQLYNQGIATRQQFEAVGTQLSAAEAQYKSAQEQLQMVKQGATKEAVNIVQNQVQQAEADLEAAKVQLVNGTITAPVSGTVTAKNINVGELASPGATLLSIVNDGNLYINAYLPSGMIQEVKEGQQVIVKVSEIPDKKFDGEITLVNSVVNSANKNILVKVSLKDPDSVLRPGMFAEIALKK